MKKSSFLALAVAPMILGAPLASQAQSVTTDPVGFVKSPVSDGTYTLIGVNMNSAAVYGAAVDSATADTITVGDSEANIEALIGDGTYYVEITSGDFEGDRLDIASASGNVITLDMAAGHNTLSDASSIPAGSTIVVRKHYTFADLAANIEGGNLVEGNTASEADQILTFEDGGFAIHFLGTGGGWWSAAGFEASDDKVIPPGSGVLFYANPAGGARDLEVLTLGEVRANDLVRPLSPGFQIVSTGFPLDLSPTDLALTSEFFQGGNSAAEADQILTFEGGGFNIHFKGPDEGDWWSAAGFAPVADVDLFGAQGAVLVYRNEADPDFRIAKQY